MLGHVPGQSAAGRTSQRGGIRVVSGGDRGAERTAGEGGDGGDRHRGRRGEEGGGSSSGSLPCESEGDERQPGRSHSILPLHRVGGGRISVSQRQTHHDLRLQRGRGKHRQTQSPLQRHVPRRRTLPPQLARALLGQTPRGRLPPHRRIRERRGRGVQPGQSRQNVPDGRLHPHVVPSDRRPVLGAGPLHRRAAARSPRPRLLPASQAVRSPRGGRGG
mmetsp:Transcript_30151/g.69118  ORF Transcript_30151/g.69118 Transcript_30151/m.69118 type:complete len:218 (+) Transcript_30151:686-1339(+)